MAAGRELLDYCSSRDLRLLAYSPLLGGAYTRADRPLSVHYRGSDSERRLNALREVAGEAGATPNQVAALHTALNSFGQQG